MGHSLSTISTVRTASSSRVSHETTFALTYRSLLSPSPNNSSSLLDFGNIERRRTHLGQSSAHVLKVTWCSSGPGYRRPPLIGLTRRRPQRRTARSMPLLYIPGRMRMLFTLPQHFSALTRPMWKLCGVQVDRGLRCRRRFTRSLTRTTFGLRGTLIHQIGLEYC